MAVRYLVGTHTLRSDECWITHRLIQPLISLLFPIVLAATTTWIPPQSLAITSNDEAIAFASTTLKGTPLMAVASCESSDRQWDENGDILQGRVNHYDTGFFQINIKDHMEEALSMGDDVFTADGNIRFALYLYQTQGLRPWRSSAHCWLPKIM